MKVYVITASDWYGEDTKICSIWSTEPAAQQEKRRIQPDELAVEVKEYEVQSDLVCKGEILDSKVSGV